MAANPMMVAPFRTEFDKVLGPLCKFCCISTTDVGNQSGGIGDALAYSNLKYLLTGEREQFERSQRLGPIRWLALFYHVHGDVSEVLPGWPRFGRFRHWQDFRH